MELASELRSALMARQSLLLLCAVGFVAALRVVDRRAAFLKGAPAAVVASLAPRISRAEEPAAAAEAYFSGGNVAFLQPWFEELRYRGVVAVDVGRFEDGTRALRVGYDPSRCSYKTLLGAYWRHVDPTAVAQFPKDDAERGADFRTAIFVKSDDERALAAESAERFAASGVFKKPFVVEIAGAAPFRPVPEDGQDLYRDTKAYETAVKRSGRAKFFADAYKPVTTTACQGRVCGYVYFPCGEENGCLPVVTGRW